MSLISWEVFPICGSSSIEEVVRSQCGSLDLCTWSSFSIPFLSMDFWPRMHNSIYSKHAETFSSLTFVHLMPTATKTKQGMLRMMWCRQHNLMFSSDHQDIERVVHSMSNNNPASVRFPRIMCDSIHFPFFVICFVSVSLTLFHWRSCSRKRKKDVRNARNERTTKMKERVFRTRVSLACKTFTLRYTSLREKVFDEVMSSHTELKVYLVNRRERTRNGRRHKRMEESMVVCLLQQTTSFCAYESTKN